MFRANALRARLAKVLATVINLKTAVPDGNANDEASVGAHGAFCFPAPRNSGRHRSVGESAALYAEKSGRLPRDHVDPKDIETEVCTPGPCNTYMQREHDAVYTQQSTDISCLDYTTAGTMLSYKASVDCSKNAIDIPCTTGYS